LHENPGATAPEHFYRGNNLLRGGDYHGAEREFRRAIRLQPWDPAFYVNLGSTLVSQGPHRQSETESVGRAAVAVDPSFARAHFALGQMLLQSKRGHQREGLRRLFRAVALEPRDPELLQGVGQTLLRIARFDEAIIRFYDAARLSPLEAKPRDQLGYALSKVERLSEAHRWLESAASLGSSLSYSTAAKLVEVLLWLGDEAEARRTARRAVDQGLWRDPLQRPTMVYQQELTARPWWSLDDALGLSDIAAYLGQTAQQSKLFEEFAAIEHRRPTGWRHQPERIQEPGLGRWKEWKLKDERNKPCRRAVFPKACSTLDHLGQWIEIQWAEFSVLEPGAHIRAHTGPTNNRLTLHLCLMTPPGVRIRIGAAPVTEYRNGSVFFFDDSFEHEVWHKGYKDRVVLLVQFTHPDMAPRLDFARGFEGKLHVEL